MPEVDGRESPYAELRFELKAVLPLDQLQRFLVQLTGSDRPVRVVALGLVPRKDELETTLTLVALAPRNVLREEQR